jgi:hypothetical protein
MFSGKFHLHRLPTALLLAIAAEEAVRDDARRRRRRAEREAAETARWLRAAWLEEQRTMNAMSARFRERMADYPRPQEHEARRRVIELLHAAIAARAATNVP